MKVWITKYALTQGILEKEVQIANTCSDLVNVVGESLETYYGKDREWHLSKDGAINKAEKMRVSKINSLKEQIAKLERLDFNKM
jgi:hypothetical protein